MDDRDSSSTNPRVPVPPGFTTITGPGGMAVLVPIFMASDTILALKASELKRASNGKNSTSGVREILLYLQNYL